MLKAVRNTTIPVTFTSDFSKPADTSISSCEWSSGSCQIPRPEWSSLCVGMFSLQNLRDMRIVGLHQRPGLQTVAEEGNPEGNHRYRYGHILENSPAEVEVPCCISEIRLNQPEQIECLGKHHPLANPHQPLLVPLDVPRQQKREGNEPMEQKVQRDDDAPVPANPVQVPGNLFRQVPRPDDQKLRERQVDIQHHKRKRELAKIVLLGLPQYRLERLRL